MRSLRAICGCVIQPSRIALTMTAAVAAATASDVRADSPFASSVVSYVAGSGAVAGFNNASVALGPPERFTGEGLIPQAVTPFQPAFRPNEVVSLGVGGRLVLAFDRDVVDDPRNPHGIDLIVYGNAFFTDGSFGFGSVAGLASEGGTIRVSADGVNWVLAKGLAADGLFPTLGYLDVGPFSTTPGLVESDFLKPMDPAITLGDCVGLSYEELLALYDGSGGGTGIDLATLGLDRIRYVRIDGPTAFGSSPEIDAVADVAPVAIPGDLDFDGDVGSSDLGILLTRWGTSDTLADIDGNGLVGSEDLGVLLTNWGSGSGA